MKSRWLYLLLVVLGCAAPATEEDVIREDGVPHAAFQAWQHYLGDPGRSHYSTLTQIDTTNVAGLEVAWVYHSGGLEAGRGTQIQTNPLVVDSVLYGVNPALTLFALHAATGAVLWTFEPDEKDGSGLGVNRGLSYWAAVDGAEAHLFFASGPYLYAVSPQTGQGIASFGEGGKVDLREGLGRDPETLFVVANTPGAVYEDLLVMGTRVQESPGAAPGHIRAYDVRSGAIRWTFHTIPQPGEVGYETWPPDAYTYIGGANNWAGMALDVQRGLVFIPTGSAAFDFYGGNRHGENLFANSLLALDARTGERRWHFQFVRHDLWDRDLPAPPNLVILEREGRRIPAVAQITKSGHVFVFHRETGEPLFPIEEVAVPPSTLLGEQAWATQPLPTRPAPFARQRLTEDMLYAPDEQAFVDDFVDKQINDAPLTVRERFRQVTSEGQFVPPDTLGVIIFPGFDGGGEWGGAAVDPTRGVMYVNANEMAWIVRMGRVGGEGTVGETLYQIHCARCHGGALQGLGEIPALTAVGERLAADTIRQVIRKGRGAMPAHPQFSSDELEALVAFLRGEEAADHRAVVSTEVPYSVKGFGRFFDSRGYPVVEPPWGTLNALDLNTGDYLWQVPLGHIDAVEDADHPVTGAENYGGPVVTASGLIFIAATKDEKIRAFHARTGEALWEASLPAGGYATPTTYQVAGRQYVVIACGGGKMGTEPGDAYVAFALPDD